MVQVSVGSSRLTLNRIELDRALNSQSGEIGTWLRRRGLMMVLAAKQQVGVETGRLRDSIHMRISRDPVGQKLIISASGPNAIPHHNGTRPHIITPNDANILRFSAGGRIVYTHSVNHPGTRPNRYLSDQLWMVRV